jgi:3-hydroxyisobutyrate dehydrogenase-like beta-hydroxyacid dehydrogenase
MRTIRRSLATERVEGVEGIEDQEGLAAAEARLHDIDSINLGRGAGMRVAFIGLGNMGFPMAGHLASAGHEVSVFNRSPDKAAGWAARHGGRAASSPADAAEGAEVVCTCVGNDDDVREVVTGPAGALTTLAPGAVLVDHTTTSAIVAREVATAAVAVGIGFVDAPVSGGQAGAEAGTLSVMCGAEPAVLARVRPVLEAYGRTITHIGPVGTGQLTKMVNQVLCAAAIAGAAEALNFAQVAGLDTDLVLRAVTGGAANSWYLENRGQTMVRDEFDFGFAVDWILKDLRICLAEAARTGVPLPVTALAAADYETSHERGDGRLDATATIRLRRAETATSPQ